MNPFLGLRPPPAISPGPDVLLCLRSRTMSKVPLQSVNGSNVAEAGLSLSLRWRAGAYVLPYGSSTYLGPAVQDYLGPGVQDSWHGGLIRRVRHTDVPLARPFMQERATERGGHDSKGCDAFHLKSRETPGLDPGPSCGMCARSNRGECL